MGSWGWGVTRFKGKDPVKAKTRRDRYSLQKSCQVAGITVERYHEAVAEQNGVCAICYGPPLGKDRLSIDHDHTTGKFRGLLCDNCNRVLGHSRDRVSVLEGAIKYLRTR